MIRASVLILLLAVLSGVLRAQQELAPPDATFYGAIETARTDFSELNGEEDVNGTRLRAGLWLNDVTFGRWKLGLEGAYNRLGDSSIRDRFQRSPTGQEQNINIGGDDDPPVTVMETTGRESDVGGLELGLRLYDSELFHLRGGGYLHSFRSREDVTQKFTDADGDSITNDLTPESESTSTLGPYMGAGFAFPLTDQLRLTTDLSVYWIESEPLDSLSIGIQYRGE